MIEDVILGGLIDNQSYMRKVLPFLKEEYFENTSHKTLFQFVVKYIGQYNQSPSRQTLHLIADKTEGLSEQSFKDLIVCIDEVKQGEVGDDFIVDETEKFCKDKSLYNAIRQSISVMDGNDDKISRDAIPSLISDALAVTFNSSIGHDFINDAEERFDIYHSKEKKIAFDLDIFNKITRGGFPVKTLNVLMSSTGVGKTLVMCHMAAANMMHGRNVLYITLEISEDRIGQRVDENLMDLDVDTLLKVNKETYLSHISKLNAKSAGKLIIKEYPPSTAGAAHFRHLLNELRLKKQFVPDIVYVDYINLCMSTRRRAQGASMYEYVKAIAEELRGLAVEFGIPVVTATQVNRSGHNNSDVGLENTSESWGLPATADFMVALIDSDELNSLGQIAVKQLKNRYNDMNYYSKFVIGIDRAKMKCYDVEGDAQTLVDSGSQQQPPTSNDNKHGRFANFK